MKVVMAGASGLLGSALRNRLVQSGHQITQLVRREPHAPDEVRWDPSSGRMDASVLRGQDAVVSLSGVGIGDHRWTADYKRQLVDTRVGPTTVIAAALAEAGTEGPSVWASASAIGFYGDRGDEELTETSGPGNGFLARLVVDWEQATTPAEGAGTRVVELRTGLVLASDGGLLGRLVPLFKAGVGGRLGTGRQWQSWITVDDWTRAVEFALTSDAVRGPVNLTAPTPERNRDFSTILAARLHRPALVPTPAIALRLALGEFADEGVLASQRVLPTALEAAGFTFSHRDLGPALDAVLQ